MRKIIPYNKQVNTIAISVIIPVYNTKQGYLEECFESIKQQTFSGYEVIIVDDGSDTKTANFLDKYITNLKNWKVIHSKKAGGNVARNLGFQKSSGKYIVWLDSDDVFDISLLQKAYNVISRHNADIAIWRFGVMGNAIVWPSSFHKTLPNNVVTKKVFNWRDVPNNFFQIFTWGAWTKIFNREFLLNKQLFWDQNLQSSQDMDFCGRAMLLADRISFTDDVLIKYRTGTDDQISSVRKTPLSSYVVAKKLQKTLEKIDDPHLLKHSFANQIVKDIFYYLHDTDPEFKDNYDEVKQFLLSLNSSNIDNHMANRVLNSANYSEYYNRYIPLVSIIIPIYNVEKYLKECLDSVISQTYKNLEIILVDDKSPDSSGKIADQYAKKDERIKVIHRRKNGGLSAARSTGLSYAKGSYVAFIDSDDFIDDNWIKILTKEALQEGASVVRGYIRSYIESESATQSFGSMDQYENYYNILITNIVNKSKYNMRSSVCYAIYLKDIIDKYGLRFDRMIKNGEDELWNLQYSYYATKIITANTKVYYNRRVRDDSLMTSNNQTSEKVLSRTLLLCEMVKFMNSKTDYPKDVYIDRFFHAYSMVFNTLDGIKDETTASKILQKLGAVMNSIKYKHDILQETFNNKIKGYKDLTNLREQITEKDTTITRLNNELSSHLSIKRSAKLTVGNIKRRLKYGKNRGKQ